MLQLYSSSVGIWQQVLDASKTTIAALTASYSLLLLYFLAYRAFFHPLAKYPGPLLAKFTNLYAAYHAWTGDIHVDMRRCQQKYGDRVRYGPNRLLINSAEALNEIYSYSSNVKKFEGYKVLASQAPNTFTMPDKIQHAHRRRVISQAFSESSLRLFEPILLSRIDRFCLVLRKHLEPNSMIWTKPLDMAEHFSRLTFDLMTGVAFGLDYRTMEEPQFRYVSKAIRESNIRLSVVFQASELSFGHIDRKLFYKSAKSSSVFVSFLRKLFKDRLKSENQSRDIFSFLQQCKDPDTGEGLGTMELSTETATFVIAGSDTTSTTMAALSHYLSISPSVYQRLTREVRTVFASSDDIRLGPKLNSCVLLRGCISETLRLSPPGGASLWRQVESGGMRIGDDFIPAGCVIGLGVYSIHHDPRYWTDPFTFNPDRWINDDDAIRQDVGSRQPYFPFSMGARSCVGKPLALAQVMLTYARLLWEFDFRREEDDAESWEAGEDVRGSLGEYVLRDHITGQCEGPTLCFKSRF